MTVRTMMAVQQREWGVVDKLHLAEVVRPLPLPTDILI